MYKLNIKLKSLSSIPPYSMYKWICVMLFHHRSVEQLETEACHVSLHGMRLCISSGTTAKLHSPQLRRTSCAELASTTSASSSSDSDSSVFVLLGFKFSCFQTPLILYHYAVEGLDDQVRDLSASDWCTHLHRLSPQLAGRCVRSCQVMSHRDAHSVLQSYFDHIVTNSFWEYLHLSYFRDFPAHRAAPLA